MPVKVFPLVALVLETLACAKVVGLLNRDGVLAANQGEKIDVGGVVVLDSGTLLIGDCGQ